MTSSDSSNQLPAAPPAPPPVAAKPARPRMSDAAKKALLTSKRTVKGICKVAKARSVRKQDHEEIVQSTQALAWKARLPEAEEEALKIIYKIAFIESCRFMGQATEVQIVEYREEHGDEEGEAPTPVAAPPPPVEEREALEKLTELGAAKFKAGFGSYVEGRLKGESSVEIAARRGVTDGHVRKEAQGIEEFLRDHGRKMGLLAAVGIVVLVFTVLPMDKWRQQMSPYDGRDSSDWAAIRTNPPAPDAPALRDRARQACDEAAWQACVDDLDAAKALDPAEEPADAFQLRLEAMSQILIDEAPRGENLRNVKPPLH